MSDFEETLQTRENCLCRTAIGLQDKNGLTTDTQCANLAH